MPHYSAYALAIAPGVAETVSGVCGLPGGPGTPQGQAQPPSPQATISGVINVTSPASAITVTIRCRQGSGVGGTLVEQAQVTNMAASSAEEIPFEFVDSVGLPIGPGLYTVTAQLSVTGGTINSIEMDVNQGLGVV